MELDSRWLALVWFRYGVWVLVAFLVRNCCGAGAVGITGVLLPRSRQLFRRPTRDISWGIAVSCS